MGRGIPNPNVVEKMTHKVEGMDGGQRLAMMNHWAKEWRELHDAVLKGLVDRCYRGAIALRGGGIEFEPGLRVIVTGGPTATTSFAAYPPPS